MHFWEGERASGLRATSELLHTSSCSVVHPLNKEKICAIIFSWHLCFYFLVLCSKLGCRTRYSNYSRWSKYRGSIPGMGRIFLFSMNCPDVQ